MTNKLVDGVIIPLTPEEEAEHQAREANPDWMFSPEQIAERNRRNALANDAQVKNLLQIAQTASDQEIDNWLRTNDTRAVLATIIKYIAMRGV
jgi:hypothetical protein